MKIKVQGSIRLAGRRGQPGHLREPRMADKEGAISSRLSALDASGWELTAESYSTIHAAPNT